MLRTCDGQVAGHRVDRVGQVLPGARRRPARRPGRRACPSVPTSRATRVTSAANDESWSTIVLMVLFSSRISPLTSTVIFFDRSPRGHRLRHVGDVAHLRRQVRRHRVDRVGQVLPRARDALHVGLAAELAFGAHLARHPRHFRRERAQLVDHRVDRVLQLEDLALHVDRDLLRQVAAPPRPSSRRRCCAPARSGCRP